MNGESLFRVESLSFSYDGAPVLDIRSLNIGSGGVTVFAGPNGSGKTTLLKLLNGLLVPAVGRIFFHDHLLDTESIDELRRQSVLVHQDAYLFDGTVFSNVAYGLKLRRVRGPRLREAVAGALERVGLTGFEHRRAKRLSGGERQRVAIARALVLEPRILLLDEPTANVDADTIGLLERLIRRLREAGTTVIISTHYPGFAYRLGDQLVFLDEGRLVPGRENILKGGVESRDESFTYFRTGSRLIRCPAGEGDYTTAVIPLSDVLLSVQRIATSAQNQFSATVTKVEDLATGVRVCMECGFPLDAVITRYSADSLKVVPGSRFFVAFKASAVRLY